MTFEEAVACMQKGKVVARRSWPGFALNRGVAIHVMKGGLIRFATVKDDQFIDHFAATYCNSVAKDWEVVDAAHPDLARLRQTFPRGS